MNTQTKHFFRYFIISLGLLVLALGMPVGRMLYLKSTLAGLSKRHAMVEEDYLKRREAKEFYSSIERRTKEMIANRFMTTINQKLLVADLSKIAKRNGAALKQFYFGEPLKDRPNGLFQVIYTPVKLQLTGPTEKSIYKTIHEFHAQAKGMIIVELLKMSQVKKHSFVVEYEFLRMQGSYTGPSLEGLPQ